MLVCAVLQGRVGGGARGKLMKFILILVDCLPSQFQSLTASDASFFRSCGLC